jgi:hypothetical protein
MSQKKLIASTIVLVVAATATPAYAQLWGDYNANGKVDTADYIIYQQNLWTTHTIPNDTTPGWVMPDDHDVWSQNFGATSGGAGQGTVPEPSSLLMCAFLTALMPVLWRRR